jgi:hypothetical protein
MLREDMRGADDSIRSERLLMEEIDYNILFR